MQNVLKHTKISKRLFYVIVLLEIIRPQAMYTLYKYILRYGNNLVFNAIYHDMNRTESLYVAFVIFHHSIYIPWITWSLMFVSQYFLFPLCPYSIFIKVSTFLHVIITILASLRSTYYSFSFVLSQTLLTSKYSSAHKFFLTFHSRRFVLYHATRYYNFQVCPW